VALDLGRATRLAREYVDGELALGCRAADAARELGRVEPRAALPFLEELAEQNPEQPMSHLLLARFAARAGDSERARLELDTAEALTVRRGPTSAMVSAELRRSGQPVPAIGAARQALSLAGGPDRGTAYERLVEACLAAGRDADAERAFAAARAELPAPTVAIAAGHIAEALGPSPAPAWLTPRPVPESGSIAALVSEATGARRARTERALLLIGLTDDGERGGRALRALADLLAADGNVELARDARAEAQLLSDER
jgi:hypothetical protein